jgi:succinyl-CoA synthetase beta subunit
MKVHEYQARQMFANRGVPVPSGAIATTNAEAYEIAARYNKPVMVKAQVLVGGRGKAGGVKYAENAEAARVLATKILGMDIKGEIVRKVLVTEAVEILSESYVGIILDRAAQKPIIMVSSAGGIDIEEVAAKTPEKIHKMHVDPVIGLRPYQARDLAYCLFKDIGQVRKAADILMKLYQTFWEVDASLVEINPLVTVTGGDVLAIDAKVNIDDNGLFRHPEIAAMRDLDAENPAEVKARNADLSFVKLDGSIGCIVNGAGLAMATMDLVKRYGGEPANFLDIGGSSNPQKVVTAIQIILEDPNVRSVLINIFGGITRCDDVATGIVEAFKQFKPSVPVVVRLTGTNEKEAKKILSSIKLPSADTLDNIVKTAISLAGKAA